LLIARRLRWPWPLLFGLIVLPCPLRDVVYDFIGNRRYRWFGTRDYCVVSQSGEEHRFLTDKEAC
jgi:predicted DCC family thiol-disulfide oxidoreductase YuxK